MSDHVRIAMLGAGFIGQMHSLALREASYARSEPPIRADLRVLADRDTQAAAEVADRYGWARAVPTWSEALSDDIDLFVNAGPNDTHAPASLEAARKGIAVFCEKPLCGTADEAHDLWKAVEATGVIHRAGFIQRFVPAIKLARQMVQGGELGEVRAWRSNFLLDMRGPDESVSWRFSKSQAGLGALGDLGSHHIDLARYVAGELVEVSARMNTWSKDPAGKITDINDDNFVAIGTLDNGASAIFEASRVAAAHPLTGRFEVDGTKASISWSMERMNELVIREPGTGARVVNVLRQGDPFDGMWLPSGIQGSHPLGWSTCFAHQAHAVMSLVTGAEADNDAATFEDGYRVAEIVDAVQRSAVTGERQDVTFRS